MIIIVLDKGCCLLQKSQKRMKRLTVLANVLAVGGEEVTKIKVAVLNDYQNVALSMADWSILSDRVEPVIFNHHFSTEMEAAETLYDFPIVVAMRERMPFRSTLFDRLPNLKLLVTTGEKNAAIDVKAASKHDVMVCGTAGSTTGTAELAWALLLGLARNIVRENQAMRTNDQWQSTVGVDIFGKKLGIIGLGKLGIQVANIGKAFGMEVSAWSQNLTKEQAEEAGVRYASKDQLLSESDFISIHLVLSPRTTDLIGDRELMLMKSTAYLINTSRAAIVNQPALIQALLQQRIAGAGLDVFEVEPLPANHPYRTLPNVLATPHVGYVTEDSYRLYFKHIIEDIAAFLQGEPVRRLN